MSEVLETNIFFFITGIAVIVCTVLLSIALYHVIRILASVRRVIERIEAGSELIASDIEKLRSYFIEESIFSRLLRGILGSHSERSRSSPRRGTQPGKSEDRSRSRTELKIKGEA